MSIKSASPRVHAVEILTEIIYSHRSLSDVTFLHPLTQEICYGSLRWYYYLDDILKKLLKKNTDQTIYSLLLIGLYQLQFLDLPAYAVINETVNTTVALKKAWAKKLVNAILRHFLRQKEILTYDHHAHPEWLYQKILHDWPHETKKIIDANNQRPPFSLRVNLLRQTREKYCPCEMNPYNSCGLTLPHAMNIQQLPGFLTGEVSIQDNAAQLAAPLLKLTPYQRVLDACAAPGGKTAHILETEPTTQLIAIDISETRLKRVQDNLQRLQLLATLITGDASQPETWWDGTVFDRILVDAPCSATGVIRRHPDIKLLRQETDIKNFAKQQLALLNALWPLLKPGGLLVYATCSIFPEENTKIIEKFLCKHPDATESKIDAPWGIAQPHGRQILPGMHNMDGFYYARLEKMK